MAVEIKKQQRATERVLALIKLSAELIVNVIEADKVAVDIRQDITRKIGIQEYRSSTHEGLDKTLAFRQVLFNIVEQGVFPPCPFQKSAIFFHAD